MGIFDFFNKNKVKSVSKKTDKTNIGSSSTIFGSAQSTYSPIDSRDYSSIYSPTYNLNSAGASGSVLTTKKEISSIPTTSLEKPISIAPALFGGGTSTATGKASASQGINPVAIAGVVVAGGLGYVFLKSKSGKAKKWIYRKDRKLV